MFNTRVAMGWPRPTESRNTKAVLLWGLLLAFLHCGLIIWVFTALEGSGASKLDTLAPFEIELRPPRFAEINPDAPSQKNPPSPDAPEAAANQLAAQPDAVKDAKGVRPRLEGELKESSKVVSGQLKKSALAAPPSGAPSKAAQASASAATPSNSQKASLENANLNSESILRTAAKQARSDAIKTPLGKGAKESAEASKSSAEIKSFADAKLSSGSRAAASPSQKPSPNMQPLPRPKLANSATPGPIGIHDGDAGRVGVLSQQTRLSGFGVYQQRLIESVSSNWNQACRQSSTMALEIGSRVILELELLKDGSLKAANILHSTASTSGDRLCLGSAWASAPFGAWSDDMVRRFGSSHKVLIQFWYR